MSFGQLARIFFFFNISKIPHQDPNSVCIKEKTKSLAYIVD